MNSAIERVLYRIEHVALAFGADRLATRVFEIRMTRYLRARLRAGEYVS